MSLTVALVVLAVVVLAALVAHGLWTARQAGPRRAARPAPTQRVEPSLGTGAPGPGAAAPPPAFDAAAPGGALGADAAHAGAAGAGMPAGPGGVVPGAHGAPSVASATGAPPRTGHPPASGAAGAAVPAGASAPALRAPDEPAEAPATAPGRAADSVEPMLPEVKPARRVPHLDPLIDAIAPLALEAPISGELALTHYPPTRRAGTKPFHIEGLNAETGEWELPAINQRYGEFQAGVQLANRHGPLNEIEYSEFVQKVQGFAEGIGARADFPDMLEVVARARELDQFAGPHDANLTVHLRANGAAWSPGYLHQAAARHGFVPGVVPGRLVRPADEQGAPPVLQLSFDPQAALAEDPNAAAVRDVTLSLDVPQTPESAEPFAAWQEAARALARGLDAALVDDRGQPITLHAFAQIGEELAQLYRALEGRGLAAGSAAARRLFS